MDSFAKLGIKKTRALKSAMREPDPAFDKKQRGGVIRFLCTSEVSKKVTGNGVGGDDRIIWDRRYNDQMKEAREKFYELIALGYLAYRVKKDGKPCSERLTEFDPDAEEIFMQEIIMVPAHKAG